MTDTNQAIGEWAEGLRAATTPADAITPPNPETVQARLLDLARQLEWMGATEQAASASAVAADLAPLFDALDQCRADLEVIASYSPGIADYARTEADRHLRRWTA